MKPEVVSNFINNAIIRQGTELAVTYMSHATFGTPSKLKGLFKVARIINDEKGKFYFTLADLDFPEKSIIAIPEQILEIDGMTQERIIEAFKLSPDGVKIPRKRRKKREMRRTQNNLNN